MRMAMMAITTKSSISVKPGRRGEKRRYMRNSFGPVSNTKGQGEKDTSSRRELKCREFVFALINRHLQLRRFRDGITSGQDIAAGHLVAVAEDAEPRHGHGVVAFRSA